MKPRDWLRKKLEKGHSPFRLRVHLRTRGFKEDFIDYLFWSLKRKEKRRNFTFRIPLILEEKLKQDTSFPDTSKKIIQAIKDYLDKIERKRQEEAQKIDKGGTV